MTACHVLRCRQLHMLLPDWLPTYWLKVVSQPWEGDVTMVLPSLVWQIKKAVSNPTQEELREAVKLVSVLLCPALPIMKGGRRGVGALNGLDVLHAINPILPIEAK